jgi:electron transport complex protein RnfG
MVLALLGVTLIASASLGFVYSLTKAPIEKAEMEKQSNAIAAVLPEFKELGEPYKILPNEGRDSLEIYPALDQDGETIANAIKTYTYNGYSGYIEVMVGIDKNNSITGFEVLKHTETPGLGAKMHKWHSDTTKVRQNLIGRTFENGSLKVSKDGGDIDAITAATITSRALLDALNRANTSIEGIDAYSGATSDNNEE